MRSTRLAVVLLMTFASAATALAGPSEELQTLVDEWYDQFLERNPVYATFNGVHDYNDRLANDIGAEHRAETERLERDYLARVEAIDPDQLEGQDRLSWEIFRRDRQESIAAMQFPEHLMPINQMFSMPIFFVQMGSPGGMTPFATADDYDAFLGRARDFAVWMDQAIANMREGIEQRVVQPKIIVEKTMPVLASQVVEDPKASAFHAVVKNFPEGISAEDQARLTEAYETVIAETLVPAYRRVHEFLRDEYLEHARETTALGDLPNGADWYRLAIAQQTTTSLTAEEIHELGKSEVERITKQMRELASTLGFEGDLGEMMGWINTVEELKYDSEEHVLERYRALRDVVNERIDEQFSLAPEADFEIRAVEPFRQATTPGAHYMAPSPDGSRPGIFYVNTGGWENRNHAMGEALYLHEAVPGHHFQVALSRELDELPRFRRFNGYSAYSEGWGLYAEALGEDLGLYEDPYQKLGQLGSELFRARRLVVDTGLHALGWSRDEGLAYLGSEVEIDRYLVMPGQALSYKVGELKIQELRQRAAEALGEGFDIRQFHAEILKDGPLPLDVLEIKIDRWIAESARAGR